MEAYMDIKVSVVFLTYNHEDTVRQAIESVLMQKTNFEYEILVAEDCSTDRTREILREYKKKYPDRIKLLFKKENVGVIRNLVSAYKLVRGKYIAILEGDDYWNDESKLQKQYDFMERNAAYSACFSDAYVIDETGRDCLLRTKNYDIPNMEVFFSDCKYIPTASWFFRAYILKENNYFKFFQTKVTTDVIMHVICLRHGMLHHINEKMVTYRYIVRNGKSYSAQKKEFIYYDAMMARRMQVALIKGYKCSLLEKVLTYRKAYTCLANKQSRLFYYYYDNGNVKEALKFFFTDMRLLEKISLIYNWIENKKK